MTLFTVFGPWFGSLIALALGGTVLVGLAALLSRWLRQPVWQRAVWQMCIIGLGLLFLSEGSGLVDRVIAWSRQSHASDDDATVGLVPEEERASVQPGGESAPIPQTATGPADRFTEQVGAGLEEAKSEATISTPPLPIGPSWWLGVIWLAGAMLVASRILFARALLVVFRRRCISISEGALVERVSKIAQQIGVRRRVRVVEAPRLLSPAAIGFFHPTIALPAGFADSHSPEQQDVIVAHELAHLAAHDPAWRFFADLVTALWWWHPLVWWSRHQLHAVSEIAADEASLIVTDGPALLASCLVELGGRMLGERQAGWVRMTGNGFRSGLGRRVKRLLSMNAQSRRPPRRWRLAVSITLGPVLLMSAALFSTAWARPRPSDEGGSPMTMREAWQHSFAGMLVCVALTTNESAAGGEEVVKPAAPEPVRREAITPPNVGDEDPREKPETSKDDTTKPSSKIKVFRLKHVELEVVARILARLLDITLVQDVHGTGSGERLPKEPDGVPGFGGLTINMKPPARFAVDVRTQSLIVRGSEKDLALAVDLVAVLDLPADKPIPKVKNLAAYRLNHAKAPDVAEVLYRLRFHSRVAPAELNTLIVAGPEEELKQIGEVIEQLDVEREPAKPEKKPEGGTGDRIGGGN